MLLGNSMIAKLEIWVLIEVKDTILWFMPGRFL